MPSNYGIARYGVDGYGTSTLGMTTATPAGNATTRSNRRSCLSRMFASLHRQVEKQPNGTPVLTISYLGGGGSCLLRLEGASLQTWPADATVAPLILDLRPLRVRDVATAINAAAGYQAVVSDAVFAAAPAVCLVDAIQDLAQPPRTCERR
jgi:hypothetical protein